MSLTRLEDTNIITKRITANGATLKTKSRCLGQADTGYNFSLPGNS